MAINFPDSPIINQIFVESTSGFYYQWDGTVWKSYSASSTSNIKIIDDISGSFNGSTQTFTLTISTVSFSPVNAQQLIVVLGGVVQAPTTDYTISDSNITFTTAPIFGLTCSIVSIGSALPQSAIENGTVTPAKLSTGGPSWNTGGDVYISGVTTITNASGTVIAGIGTTALIVNGNARVTGILTIGTSSITLNGSSDQVNVGSATTIHTGGFRIGSSDLHSTGITVTNANILGVVTASSFSGPVSGNATGLTGTPDITVRNITGVAATFTGNANISGVVTASSFSGPVSGNATGLTGTPDITVRNITGVAATFTGNVSIAGTLTYEDVTNVDSVGLITARSGVIINSGGLQVTGVTTVAAGSTSAPTINPSGDSNTGIFFPAADTIAFSEGGAESGRFNSSGNLLVGTTSDTGTASQRLQVTGNAYVSSSIGIGTTNPNGISGQTSQLTMVGSNAGGGAGYHQFLTVSNSGATNPSKFFRLNSTGGIEIVNNAYTAILFTFTNSGDFSASGNVTGYSDETLKDNIQTIPDALDKVIQLRGVEFDRNDIEGNPHQIGVIAQEVEKIIPEVVITNDDGIKSVAYGNLVGLLIEAVKDQQKQINELKARLEEI
jgi:hypothetical protein